MKCKACGKAPNELSEYVSAAKVANITPEEYIRKEEGTYNRKTDLFFCTPCYVKVGMPLGQA